MKSLSEYLRSLCHTLKEDEIIEADAICGVCQKSAVASSAFTIHDATESYYVHKTCSEFPVTVNYHPHPLTLEVDIVIRDEAACHVCNDPVIGSPTYTCVSRDVNDDCGSFYLHKSCAELSPQRIHHKHMMHPLSLVPRPADYSCDVCRRVVKVSYACVECEFDVCVCFVLSNRECFIIKDIRSTR